MKTSRFGDVDRHLFNEGQHVRLYEKLGAHPGTEGTQAGTAFAVWAPNADCVEVIGDWNGWGERPLAMAKHEPSGIWEAFAPEVGAGRVYKYRVHSRFGGYKVEKADPFAFYAERPPATGSVVWTPDYHWGDSAWMAERRAHKALETPISIYEVHLGSWMRVPEEDNRSLTYREIAPRLAEHVRGLGFTHIELMPVLEHPFYGSWGYQVTGFFAPTARYGTPEDFMHFVDLLHQQGIGVILDWPPAHFPEDEHGLVYFDGTHLYEHADPRQGRHPEWGSAVFNYGRHEVRSFLLSSANFWLDRYHIDGLRVDAVASMLYLDYGRREGDWIPNKFGGKENLEAIQLLRELNLATYREHPGVQTFAEESTAWPMVSRPTYTGGLGFGFKWDMGWMHDTLDYFGRDPLHRRYHHGRLTFRGLYAFSENYVLPLSHDEVVHGKQSLLSKMPGDRWQKFANLRLLYAYMWAQPGKKMLFMGSEFGQWREWNHDGSLDWHLLDESEQHGQLQLLVGELNRVYREERSLHELDASPEGFEWIEADDAERSVLCFMRKARGGRERVIAVFNATPVPRFNYRVGVDDEGLYEEILNTDAHAFGGSGHGNAGAVEAAPVPWHGRRMSLSLILPPLGALFFKRGG